MSTYFHDCIVFLEVDPDLGTYLKLGMLFPLTRFVEGAREIIEADLDNCFSPVSKLRWES